MDEEAQAPVTARPESTDTPPSAPAWNEREGPSSDAPQVNLLAAIADHEQLLADRREIRNTVIPNLFDAKNRPVTIPVPVTWTEEEYREKAERFDRFRSNIARLGDRVLSDDNARLANRAEELTANLARVDSRLADLLPDSRNDLGDIGEYSAEDYGTAANGLWAERVALVAQLEVLAAETAIHADQRETGGYGAGLNTIITHPAMETRFVEQLQGADFEELEIPAPTFREIDLEKLTRLRSASQAKLNRVERIYAELRDRDERRDALSDATAAQMSQSFPAMRSRLRRVT